jgi:hypothetical protein
LKEIKSKLDSEIKLKNSSADAKRKLEVSSGEFGGIRGKKRTSENCTNLHKLGLGKMGNCRVNWGK